MLFSSALFIVWFLPLFLGAYILSPQRFRNAVAFFGSFVFYAWGAPIFCAVLLISGSLDYLISARLTGVHAKRWLTLAIVYNIGTLFIFKYFNFFAENFERIATNMGLGFPAYMEIALPLGISFFTFQKVSYLIDVYRKDTPRAEGLLDYLLFVFLFPQLIAGPIVRYKELASQIKDRTEHETWSYRIAGFQRFVLGLAKKVLIADVLAPVADAAFASEELNIMSAVLGVMAYTFQIYFDFSGYSDMAIGLGKMMGFRFPENFEWPYMARGFRDFWNRWHITLGSWMKDYLYVPLGGNRSGKIITLRNLWIVFLLSGLWHGASWNFVIWGAWHGFFLTVDRITGFFSSKTAVGNMLLTFTMVSLGWIWFRAESTPEALNYWKGLLNTDMTVGSFEVTTRQWTMLAIAIVFSFLPASTHGMVRQTHRIQLNANPYAVLGFVVLLLLCLGQIAVSANQPFIYFRF